MATEKQIEAMYVKLTEAHPAELFKHINDIQAGISAVLRLLHEADTAVTAGKISEMLNISTARVTVLLKKMTAKGLILKEQSATDGRVTVVRLTESGKEAVSRMYNEIYTLLGCIIDTVGEEKLLEFVATSKEIKAVVKNSNLKFWD